MFKPERPGFLHNVPSLHLLPFNLYAEYIMRKAGLEEAQAGIKIAWRNISNLRYADDTIFRKLLDQSDN